MQSRANRWPQLLAAFPVLIGSCRDATAPLNGVFTLQTVGGEAVPANTRTLPDGGIVIADTLVFLPGAGLNGYLQFEERTTYQDADGSLQHSTILWGYRRKSNRIEFLPPWCGGPAANCGFAPREGRVDGDQLTITFSDPIFRVQIFRRVQ